MRRREFVAACAVQAAPLAGPARRICLFTDHLRGFEYAEVARMLRELGISGPDLTLRPGGLVRPDQVEIDLPRAAAIFQEHGLSIPMVTTAITSAEDPLTRRVLSAIAKQKIGFYKLGYFRYPDLSRWRETIDATRRELQALARIGRETGVQAGIHNHATTVGGAGWDCVDVLEGVEPEFVGSFFDVAHATVEGGRFGWNLSFRRLAPRFKMIAIKDFVWEKTANEWKSRWVPLGQGMVDWPAFFALLRHAQWPGPISLHIEYDPGGSTKEERYDKALAAAARDLEFLRKHLQG